MLLQPLDLCLKPCHCAAQPVVEHLGELFDLRGLPVLVTVECSFVEGLNVGLDLGAPAGDLLVGVGVKAVEGIDGGTTEAQLLVGLVHLVRLTLGCRLCRSNPWLDHILTRCLRCASCLTLGS